MMTEPSFSERAQISLRNNTNATPQRAADPITQRGQHLTTRINRAELDLFMLHQHTPFGLRTGAAATYQAVPRHKSIDAPANGLIWRIELHGLARAVEAIGFDIVGDVVLGRTPDATQPVDIALDRFCAADQGVSRRHAMLRPTRNCLYLLDLNSTNGTFYNAMRLGCGVVHSVKNDDTITLGSFAF